MTGLFKYSLNKKKKYEAFEFKVRICQSRSKIFSGKNNNNKMVYIETPWNVCDIIIPILIESQVSNSTWDTNAVEIAQRKKLEVFSLNKYLENVPLGKENNNNNQIDTSAVPPLPIFSGTVTQPYLDPPNSLRPLPSINTARPNIEEAESRGYINNAFPILACIA